MQPTNPRDERETERPRNFLGPDRVVRDPFGGHEAPSDFPLPSTEELMALVKESSFPAMPPERYAALAKTAQAERALQRLLGTIAVSSVPQHLKNEARELAKLLGHESPHLDLAPKSAEVVNDPELHAKAMAEAMAKENALAQAPSTDPALYDPEAVREFTERAYGQREAIEAAYQDGFAMGQRNMAEQLSKLTLAQLVKANVRKNLGQPASLVEDKDLHENPDKQPPAATSWRDERAELVDVEVMRQDGSDFEVARGKMVGDFHGQPIYANERPEE